MAEPMIQIAGISRDQLLDLASEFTIQPPDFQNGNPDSIRIVKAFQADGSVRWAVYQGYWQPQNILNRRGRWEIEPSPANRDEDYYRECRFDSFEAAFRAVERITTS